MSGIINKVKDALHSDKSSSTTHTNPTHSTSSGVTGTNTHNPHAGTGVGHSSGTAEGVAGPHNSRVANAADPRVDSDRDGSHNTHTTGSGLTGNNHSSGVTGNNHGSTNAGPHSSNAANALDPRIDSDRSKTHGTSGLSGTHAGNTSGTHTGTTGGISHSTNAGPHNSNALNKADPRVDSDLDGRGNRHGASTGGIMGASGSHATAGSGTAQNTAGPHNSDLLNKVDPRVDSDRDGSKTFGGNKTHA